MLKYAFGFLLAVTLSAFGNDPISFSSLKDGDVIRVTFSSTGCFHRTNRVFEFHEKSVAISSPDQAASSLKKDPESSKIGTLVVSKDDLKKLDRLLLFYRENKQVGCTTVDHIQIEQTRADGRSLSEKYADASCQSEQIEDALTFPQLQARLVKQKTP